MEIEEVAINHYKSITDPVSLRGFSGFHILVGPNNAGKTNILDAINLFFEKNLEKKRFFDTDTDIKITLKENGKRTSYTYKKGKIKPPLGLKTRNSFVRINENSNYFLVAKKILDFKKKYPKKYKIFTNVLEKYFKGIEINENLFLLNVFSDNKNRPVKRMGEGFKRLFVILFYVFHPDYKIILIDEPEMHLHPSIIKNFLKILEKKITKTQILFTTHHPSFIQAKHLPYIWRASRNKKNSTAVYGFQKKNINLNRFVQEINDDNSGMLFSDKVLLVEGISDRIFMREMIDRFYKKEKDIKVVYTSGKGSIDLYADLCETFNIPFAVMLDHDAVNSAPLRRIKRFPSFGKRTPFQKKIQMLKEKEIFILEKDLEHTYPLRFKNKETKPLKALFVSQNIKKEDLNLERMKTIRDILQNI